MPADTPMRAWITSIFVNILSASIQLVPTANNSFCRIKWQDNIYGHRRSTELQPLGELCNALEGILEECFRNKKKKEVGLRIKGLIEAIQSRVYDLPDKIIPFKLLDCLANGIPPHSPNHIFFDNWNLQEDLKNLQKALPPVWREQLKEALTWDKKEFLQKDPLNQRWYTRSEMLSFLEGVRNGSYKQELEEKIGDIAIFLDNFSMIMGLNLGPPVVPDSRCFQKYATILSSLHDNGLRSAEAQKRLSDPTLEKFLQHVEQHFRGNAAQHVPRFPICVALLNENERSLSSRGMPIKIEADAALPGWTDLLKAFKTEQERSKSCCDPSSFVEICIVPDSVHSFSDHGLQPPQERQPSTKCCIIGVTIAAVAISSMATWVTLQ